MTNYLYIIVGVCWKLLMSFEDSRMSSEVRSSLRIHPDQESSKSDNNPTKIEVSHPTTLSSSISTNHFYIISICYHSQRIVLIILLPHQQWWSRSAVSSYHLGLLTITSHHNIRNIHVDLFSPDRSAKLPTNRYSRVVWRLSGCR